MAFIVLAAGGIVYGQEMIERIMIYLDFLPVSPSWMVACIVVLWWFQVSSGAYS